MSLLAATQISKPADEQAFERASVVLWRCLLNDPSVQRNGRRGQRQNGVDLSGIRDGDTNWHVGVQCKLKTEGHTLSKDEVVGEVKKALTFKPMLREFYITTTAPDDVVMQELARLITSELATEGKRMRVSVWGWNTLEERISEYAAARKEFDPTFTMFGEEILAETKSISSSVAVGFSTVIEMIAHSDRRYANRPGDGTIEVSALEAHLDAEIDEYRQLNDAGKTLTAMPLLERLLARIEASASGRILFRIKANIGHCLMALNEDKKAAEMLLSSYEHAQDEPKAIANKAFGLLLRGDWQQLIAFGKSQLEIDPANEWLAGYLVQAARFDMTITDPLGLVPEQLRQTASVQIAWVDFVRRRGASGTWWGHARRLVADYPSEPTAVQFAAEADFDEILTSSSFLQMRVLHMTERQRLRAATVTLKSQWDRERVSDGPLRPEDIALCGNVIVGLAALDEFSEARDVARQGIALAPADADLLIRATVVAIEAGDDALASELLPRLPVTHDSVVLKFRFHAERANWTEVVELFANNVPLIPATEMPIITATAELAAIKIRVDDPEKRRSEIAAVADAAANDARASIVVADFARRDKMEDIADAAFEAALGLIDENSHMADRLMVAHHAHCRGDAAIVVNLLAGKIAEDHDSSELRMLARAFVNDSPIRQRALSFFKRLPPAVANLPYFLQAKGLLHFNRGALPEAEIALREAATVQPDLESFIALFSVLHRLDRGDEMKAIVDDIDLETVKGTPSQKMYLAQVMRMIGRGSQALEFAYKVLQSARNDHRVVLRYFGLIMVDPEEDLIPLVDAVAVDTWVRLESDRQERHAFLIEDGVDRPADDILSPSHLLAKAALNLRVGDEFEMPLGHGGTRRWCVAEIKHKYLHALHDVIDNFESRFPNAKGFYAIPFQDGDIQPALDQVRRVAEGNRRLADLYLVNNIPIKFVVANSSRDDIQFADYLRFLDFNIRSCTGTEHERFAATKLLYARQYSGAVVDTYTAWTLATMDAFDVLESVFGLLVIPQTTIDEIKNLRDEYDANNRQSVSLTWHNGKFFREEQTAEDRCVRRDYIVDQIRKIESKCSVCPVIAPDEPTDVAALIAKVFGGHVLDSANLAGENYILVSEDMHYRQLASVSCGVRGVWLQAVFSFAFDRGMIDHRRYAELVAKLASRRHEHLALDADVILAIFDEGYERDLSSFKDVANFIGTQNAEIRSHIAVATEVMNRIWRKKGHADLYCMKATSILLRCLIRYRTNDWAIVLALVQRNSLPYVRSYIVDWINGHFLPAEDVAIAAREIERRSNQSLEYLDLTVRQQISGSMKAKRKRRKSIK
ncbi:PIN domain-containing protein [Methylobrevis albus]|uniref:PIN domain-containing protein n=1 Tax=Methylobrevis albus TaxID=2793297 RepID=A0A931MY18_9HYPH|nr:hypothetical protein [Methylobrevis albus]MBH0237550.1 hypothetical protein [Methylobrevis albus]